MCYPHLSSAFVLVMHFSRSCIVARICVTFNYPTIVLALLMQLFNNKQSALFLLYFVPFRFHSDVLSAPSSLSQIVLCVSKHIRSVFFFSLSWRLRRVFGCERIIVLTGKLMSICSWVIAAIFLT
jgi:hypothetical protein